jgi:phosphoribosyl 1,2-cyclic phosphodiesterase
MQVTFWGVRGSVPWATAASIGHGCNTPCVELRDDRTNSTLVLDAGSGIVGLGSALTGEPRSLPILLTHFHWDHTQGLPFFEGFYKQGWRPAIWAPRLRDVDAAWVETIFDQPFFPVPIHRLPSRPEVHVLPDRDVDIGGFHVRAQLLHHPGDALAYRIGGSSGDLVYATDHEFGDANIDEAFGRFARGARAIILDAHFTPEELPRHRGWGHSSWRQCAEFAAAQDIGHLWLFHHKPGRSDGDQRAIAAAARAIFPNTTAAREGEAFRI